MGGEDEGKREKDIFLCGLDLIYMKESIMMMMFKIVILSYS